MNESGLVDENTAQLVTSATDVVQNQAEADRDATFSDRLKMAGGLLTVLMTIAIERE